MQNNNLRKVQLVQLEIAKEIKRICDMNQIQYFLDSGTLLGAVRHKGFIPWDDDLDIGMYRTEFNKFLEIAPSCIDPKYEIQTWQNDKNYGNAFIKVRKKGTRYVEKVSQKQQISGIYVDILPYDIFPENKRQQQWQGRRIEIIKRLIYAKSGYKNWEISSNLKSKIKRRLIYVPLQFMSFFVTKEALIKKYDVVATKFNNSTSTKVYEQTGATKYSKWVVPKECIFDLKLLEFEKEFFLAPQNYEVYLTSVYGNYMDLPPENQRYNRHNIIEISFGDEV